MIGLPWPTCCVASAARWHTPISALVALALALHVVGLIITGERWRVVIGGLGSRLSLYRTTLINLAGIFVRNATPTTGLGGDASRIALLRAHGVPLAQATASFAYVRLAEVPPLALRRRVLDHRRSSRSWRADRASAVSVAALSLRGRRGDRLDGTRTSARHICRRSGRARNICASIRSALGLAVVLRDAGAGRDDRAADRRRRRVRAAVDDPAVGDDHRDDHRRRLRADRRQHRRHRRQHGGRADAVRRERRDGGGDHRSSDVRSPTASARRRRARAGAARRPPSPRAVAAR